jgi:hypothetical protein
MGVLELDVRGNGGCVSQAGTGMAVSFFDEPFLRSRRFANNEAGELVYNGDP